MDNLVKPPKQYEGTSFTLSTIDQVAPRAWNVLALYFSLPDGTDNVEIYSRLRQGLECVAADMPVLAGMYATENVARHTLRIDINADTGIICNMRDYTVAPASEKWTAGTFEEMKAAHFPTSYRLSPLLFPKVNPKIGVGSPVMATQANFITGGLLLVCGGSHNFADAGGWRVVFDRWAAYTAAGTTIAPSLASGSLGSVLYDNGILSNVVPSMSPTSSRAGLIGLLWNTLWKNWEALRGTPSSITPLSPAARVAQPDLNRQPLSVGVGGASPTDFLCWKLLTVEQVMAMMTRPQPTPPEIASAVIHFSRTHLEKLKKDASPTTESGKWISTMDAVTACLWYHIMRARAPDPTTTPKSLLNVSYNFRTRLSTPLPPTYIGNAAAAVPVEADMAAMRGEAVETVRALAALVRQAVTSYDPNSTIPRMIGLINSLPIPSLWTVDWPGPRTPGNLLFTDALRHWGDLYWGKTLGRFTSVRALGLGPPMDGTCFVLPKSEDGGIEISVVLEKGALQRLQADDGLLKFAEFHGTT